MNTACQDLSACYSFVSPAVEVITRDWVKEKTRLVIGYRHGRHFVWHFVSCRKERMVCLATKYICVCVCRVQRSLMWMSNMGSCTLVLSFAIILKSVALFLAAV